jgi:Sodium:sulfate symporter transmembrane region
LFRFSHARKIFFKKLLINLKLTFVYFKVGTPPNAIVAGVGNIRTKDMALAGVGPTIFTLIVTIVLFPT